MRVPFPPGGSRDPSWGRRYGEDPARAGRFGTEAGRGPCGSGGESAGSGARTSTRGSGEHRAREGARSSVTGGPGGAAGRAPTCRIGVCPEALLRHPRRSAPVSPAWPCEGVTHRRETPYLEAFAWLGPRASRRARGATFTVSNTNDGGPGSLRQAILDTNAAVVADHIASNWAYIAVAVDPAGLQLALTTSVSEHDFAFWKRRLPGSRVHSVEEAIGPPLPLWGKRAFTIGVDRRRSPLRP